MLHFCLRADGARETQILDANVRKYIVREASLYGTFASLIAKKNGKFFNVTIDNELHFLVIVFAASAAINV